MALTITCVVSVHTPRTHRVYPLSQVYALALAHQEPLIPENTLTGAPHT